MKDTGNRTFGMFDYFLLKRENFTKRKENLSFSKDLFWFSNLLLPGLKI